MVNRTLILSFSSISLFIGSLTMQAQAAPDLAAQLTTIDNAASGAPIFRTAETTKAAFEACYLPATKTEFDTADTLLIRAAKAPCRFAGITTSHGRGDQLYGDILKYDSERQVAYWAIPMQAFDNLLPGGTASPYDLTQKQEMKSLTGDQKNDIKNLFKVDFLLIPLYGEKDATRTYDATNGFGAKTNVTELSGTRYSIAVNVGKQIDYGKSFPVVSINLPRDKAADLMPYLDLKLYWVASRPCAECLLAGTEEMAKPSGPTFTSPYDIKLTHHYVFGSLIAVKVIDRRDGSTVAISAGGH